MTHTIEPYTEEWEEIANDLARNFGPEIYPCCKCNYPVIDGYCCMFCGDSNPSETEEQEVYK